ATSIGKNGISGGVEILLFENHTACECQPINDLPRLQEGLDNLQDGEEDLPSKSKCVLANQCHIPDCEYGLFNPESGYCPRRHDEDQRIHRRPNQLHHNHRWSHIERD
ncbi:hypothetical protein AVEN_228849-1, partial [Araneus ventricosus]